MYAEKAEKECECFGLFYKYTLLPSFNMILVIMSVPLVISPDQIGYIKFSKYQDLIIIGNSTWKQFI